MPRRRRGRARRGVSPRMSLTRGPSIMSRSKDARRATSVPARFMLVAAMNPTRRGSMAGDGTGQAEMQRYLARISGPLIDRVDIHVEVPAVPYCQLRAAANGTTTETMRRRVAEARGRQLHRQGPGLANAELTGRALDRHGALDDHAATVLGQAMSELGLSARAYDRIRRVGRTIADLDASDRVETHHIAEAVQYRLLDRLL